MATSKWHRDWPLEAKVFVESDGTRGLSLRIHSLHLELSRRSGLLRNHLVLLCPDGGAQGCRECCEGAGWTAARSVVEGLRCR